MKPTTTLVYTLFLLLCLNCVPSLWAQQPVTTEYDDYRFTSYGSIPTWAGVAGDWRSDDPKIYLYDSKKYKGHAEFVAKGLKLGIRFSSFQQNVKRPIGRDFVPFFLYDFRDKPIFKNGIAHCWGVRIEDYRYTDSQAQMEAMVIQLMQLIPSVLPDCGKNGLMILAGSRRIRPSVKVAPALKKAGFNHLELGDLVEMANSKAVEVLNEGTAVGYLRYVAKNDKNPKLTKHDIAVYESLPYRVPPLQGIITLQPQTPLSHINLLAKNRGTINVYAVHKDSIPGFGKLNNKLVKVVAKNKRLLVSSISEVAAKKWWTKKQPSRLKVPEPMRLDKGIVELGAAPNWKAIPKRIGAKAANYSLIQKTFGEELIRPGFALGFDHYFQVLEQSGSNYLIQDLLKKQSQLSTVERNIYLKEIRNTIKKGLVPVTTVLAIRQLIDEHYPTAKRIRLRSSTNCEDLPDFNGAGLYTSKGFNVIDDNHRLLTQLLKVYASLWKPLAFEEREHYGIDHQKVGMAILINEAFTDELANGVVVTIPNPQKKGDFDIWVNVQKGDKAVANPTDAERPESFRFSADTEPFGTIQSRSNLGNVFLGKPSDDPILSQLIKATKEIHQLLNKRQQQRGDAKSYGIDIEFKIMKEKTGRKLYIKQARLLSQIVPK